MASPLSGPGYGFTWDNLNNGQVAPNAPVSIAGTLTSANATITALAQNVTALKGQLVTGTGIPTPDFASAAVTNSSTLVLVTNATTSSAQTITIQNFPVLIGGEWSSTIAAGGALTSSYWNNTGVVRPVDTNQAPLADIVFVAGGTFTPGVGQALSGWFLKSFDGGTTFESAIATAGTAVPAISRSPDFIIPLDNAAYAVGNQRWSTTVSLPSEPFKTIIQNSGTVAAAANGAILCIPLALSY